MIEPLFVTIRKIRVDGDDAGSKTRKSHAHVREFYQIMPIVNLNRKRICMTTMKKTRFITNDAFPSSALLTQNTQTQ